MSVLLCCDVILCVRGGGKQAAERRMSWKKKKGISQPAKVFQSRHAWGIGSKPAPLSVKKMSPGISILACYSGGHSTNPWRTLWRTQRAQISLRFLWHPHHATDSTRSQPERRRPHRHASISVQRRRGTRKGVNKGNAQKEKPRFVNFFGIAADKHRFARNAIYAHAMTLIHSIFVTTRLGGECPRPLRLDHGSSQVAGRWGNCRR